MILEGVSVCVNYSDFLEHTLPRNKRHFHNLIIITTEADKDTQRVCRNNDVRFITTNRFYEDGAAFNKGKAINDGFAALSRTDWILHFDADMVLPAEFSGIGSTILDIDTLYGVGRYLCPNYQSWMNYKKSGCVLHHRWHYQGRGKSIGMGFFQLFNVKSKTLVSETGPWYPEGYGHAGRSDRMFQRKWGGKYTRLSDVFSPIHLEAEQAELGANWHGRKTPRFGSSLPSLQNSIDIL